jgi:hypothetical protein
MAFACPSLPAFDVTPQSSSDKQVDENPGILGGVGGENSRNKFYQLIKNKSVEY